MLLEIDVIYDWFAGAAAAAAAAGKSGERL